MTSNSKEVLLARIQTLKHVKAFVELNLKARKKELKLISKNKDNIAMEPNGFEKMPRWG